MPRPKRADEANGLYHALSRGNARSENHLRGQVSLLSCQALSSSL